MQPPPPAPRTVSLPTQDITPKHVNNVDCSGLHYSLFDVVVRRTDGQNYYINIARECTDVRHKITSSSDLQVITATRHVENSNSDERVHALVSHCMAMQDFDISDFSIKFNADEVRLIKVYNVSLEFGTSGNERGVSF